ncbi:Stemmadenine O-acetyltransferase [Sesamum alatum]|uniref:Stemmadenine O-acetyltransferase n=1 Tax=Sesamum alatum TaxID=300844 RepID=A0AAE1XLX1_9LAMI|nr:Stemmadenine O-acetyltransferase [Sesamum alatum]
MDSAGSVHVISKELIKPSSPTPDHLKTLNLSVLDQITPPVYISLIFFYEADELKGSASSMDQAQVCQHLKQSLSNTLTSFYPLAGKIDPESYTVYCDDEGVEFVEARAHARLRDVVQDAKLEEFQKFLPVDPLRGIHVGEGGTLFMVQINFFDCGGVAVAACVSHLVADGSSLVDFMNAWAATCRGENPKSAPEFGVFGRCFPARDLSDSNISPALLMGNDKLVTKRIVFDKEKLAALKQAAATGSDDVRDPTRVEAVSAFILKHFIEHNPLDANKTLLAAGHAVNIRSRASPPLDNTFGNGCVTAAAEFSHQHRSPAPELHELASKLRRAIRTIDDEYIRETEREDRFLRDLGRLCDLVSEGEAEAFLFSSWCRFPMYEVDFGWGKPVWVCTTALLVNNLAILMSTRDGNGIEAWINLLPDHVQSLEEQFKHIGSTNQD